MPVSQGTTSPLFAVVGQIALSSLVVVGEIVHPQPCSHRRKPRLVRRPLHWPSKSDVAHPGGDPPRRGGRGGIRLRAGQSRTAQAGHTAVLFSPSLFPSHPTPLPSIPSRGQPVPHAQDASPLSNHHRKRRFATFLLGLAGASSGSDFHDGWTHGAMSRWACSLP